MLESRLRWIFLFLLAVAASFAEDLNSLPKPTGYVSDFANVIGPSDKTELESFCTKVQEQLGAQFAIVTIKTLDNQSIETYAVDLFRKWGIGQKGTNEGLLILVVVQDRRDRIEVGRGLEPYITDAISGDVRRVMEATYRSAGFGGALTQGVRSLAAKVADGKQIAFSEAAPIPQRTPRQDDGGNSGGFPISLIIFAAVFLLIFFLNRRGGGGRGSGSNAGFWTGMVLNSMLNSGRGGGSWGGGGGFGGGSGGGGGFGGFGGGDSGGGGSSGSW